MMILTRRKSYNALISVGVLLVMLLSIASFAKIPAVVELHVAGLHGRIHDWKNLNFKLRSHKVKVEVPANAPIIISDFHSNVGANGLPRTGKHRGVDMFAETGSPVIAAADGKVIKAKNDRCWGPTILVRHGRDKDGKRMYALYGHVRNINVEVGQRVKRGQQIAEMGEDIFTNCGGGLHHLHFQLSYSSTQIPLGWGWANFVADGATAPNPHDFWENGKGKITCFEKGKKYSRSGLTYPLPCLNKSKPIGRTILAQKKRKPVVIAKAPIQKKRYPRQVARTRSVQRRPVARPRAAQKRPVARPVPRQAYKTMQDEWQEPIDSAIFMRQGREKETLESMFNSYVGESPRRIQQQDSLPVKTAKLMTFEDMFIASGISHFSLTNSESTALFSSMSDWPE